jgi:hypothetical protein
LRRVADRRGRAGRSREIANRGDIDRRSRHTRGHSEAEIRRFQSGNHDRSHDGVSLQYLKFESDKLIFRALQPDLSPDW